MSISDIENLNYLMSKLTGEAWQAVSGILLSNENYSLVVELLKDKVMLGQWSILIILNS